MNIISLSKNLLMLSFIAMLIVSASCSRTSVGHTEITKWQYGKKGAVSITYDDGSINQFRKAIPIMNRLELSGTFFINTGSLPGSKYVGKFIGRPVSEIISESKTIPTNENNVYERASAARFLGFRETGNYFTQAGAQIDVDNYEEAYEILDELYKKVANGELQPTTPRNRTTNNDDNVLTWEMAKTYALQGHEFASHMVTHPYLAALDETNILYELEKSKEEIIDQLGERYAFSAECPYGTENERVMEYAYEVYPALRNRMPEEYLLELNRPSLETPVNPNFEYVQWQRGAISSSALEEMKAWVDTAASQGNIWLVLVIHGIDGIGWEALTSEDVDAYFTYIKSRENDVWVATFGDVTRYMKERMNATVSSSQESGKINVAVDHSLDKNLYDLPLTLKTYVNPKWKEVNIKQGNSVTRVKIQRERTAAFAMYQAMPGEGLIEISEIK